MSGKKLQEELHTPQIPKDEPENFSLEDILREFGAPTESGQGTQQGTQQAAISQPAFKETAQATQEVPPTHQPKPKGKPIREEPPVAVTAGNPGEKGIPSREQTETDKQIYQCLDLVQTGLVGRRVRLVLCFLLSVAAVALTVAQQFFLPEDFGNSGLVNLGQLGILILCALLCLDVFFSKRDGFAGVGLGYRLLMLYELILAIPCGFLLLVNGQSVISAPVCMTLTFSLLGVHIRSMGVGHTLEASQACTHGDTLFCEPDFDNRKPGIMSARGSKAVLLRGNAAIPAPQRAISIYALLVIFVSLTTAVVAPQDNLVDLLKNALITALMGTPLSALLAWFLPWSILAKKMRQKGAALCGWRGVKKAARSVVVPLSDEDLFSPELMSLNGVKFFGGADPDKVVACTASLMDVAGGSLKVIFRQQADQRGLCLSPVDRFRRYDSGGVSGEIGEDSVLIGTLRFLQAMGVALPGGTKVNQAIYVAINGDLAGVFAINYGITAQGAEAMTGLASYKKAAPAVTAVDFMVTDSFLRSKYQIATDRFVFPLLSQKAQLIKRKVSDSAVPCAIYGHDRLPVTVLTLRGSRQLRKTGRWCAMLAILSGLFGLAIVMAVLLGKGTVVAVEDVLYYQSLWLVPVFFSIIGMKLI